jgi:WD40 repeat protein
MEDNNKIIINKEEGIEKNKNKKEEKNKNNKDNKEKEKEIDYDEDDIEMDEEKELSIEYLEDEEIELDDDDGLVDNDDIENMNKDLDTIKEKIDDINMDDEEEINIEYENINYKKEFEDFQTEGEIYSIDINDKGIVVIGDGSENTYFYDLDKKELIKKEKINKDSVSCVKFSNDNNYLVTGSLDGTVTIFETKEFTILKIVEGSSSEVNWLEWHPKGPVFAFGCEDASVWVYHAINTKNNMSFFGHTESVTCGKFTPDGKYLVTTSEDCSTKIWDLKNNTILYTIKGKKYHKAPVSALALGKNKAIIATGSFENEIALASYESGNVIFVY